MEGSGGRIYGNCMTGANIFCKLIFEASAARSRRQPTASHHTDNFRDFFFSTIWRCEWYLHFKLSPQFTINDSAGTGLI
jgi:hypothetical protein